jgi:hypothetical protein
MRFNQILIVDSIPAGERNTARELYHDVGLRAQVFAPAPEVRYRRVESQAEFLMLLPELVSRSAMAVSVRVGSLSGNT